MASTGQFRRELRWHRRNIATTSRVLLELGVGEPLTLTALCRPLSKLPARCRVDLTAVSMRYASRRTASWSPSPLRSRPQYARSAAYPPRPSTSATDVRPPVPAASSPNVYPVLSRQCLDRRAPDAATQVTEGAAWEAERSAGSTAIRWRVTAADARIRLHRLHPAIWPGLAARFQAPAPGIRSGHCSLSEPNIRP